MSIEFRTFTKALHQRQAGIYFRVLVWPLALLYLISFNNRGSKRVCLRVSSQGQIEESGYSLEVLKRERKRARQIDYFVILPIVIVLFALSVLLLWHLTYGR